MRLENPKINKIEDTPPKPSLLKTKAFKIVLSASLILSAIAGTTYLYAKDKGYFDSFNVSFKSQVVYEYGDDVNSLLSELNNRSLIKTNKPYQSLKIGEVKTDYLGYQLVDYTFTYKDVLGKQHSHTVKRVFQVVDTKAPVITQLKELTITEGEEFKLEDYFKASDLKDKDIKLITLSNFDTTKANTYPLVIQATDSSNNTTRQTLTLEIKPKPVVLANPTTTKKTTTKKYKKPTKPVPNAVCPYGIYPNKPCNWLIPNVRRTSPNRWGNYSTLNACDSAGSNYVDQYARQLHVNSWYCTSYHNNLGDIAGFTLFLTAGGKFIPKP